MPSAATLRLQIETALQDRIPGALTPRPRMMRDLVPTGISELDVLLEGGLPMGAITELVGPQASGRTTVAMAALAAMTHEGNTVAWVDTSDTLDPESAAAAGIDLSRQLWVRCGQSSSALPTLAPQPPNSGAGAALLAPGSRMPAPGGGGGSPHPRGETRGMSQAVGAFLQPGTFAHPVPSRNGPERRKNRMIGTPGAPNRRLLESSLDRTPQDARPFPRRARDREEQIPTDRRPSRRQAMHAQQDTASGRPASLQACQIAHTAAIASSRSQAGHWTNNANNAHGRALHTPPNDIAAGLPRFQAMEAHALGQPQGVACDPASWKPSAADVHLSLPTNISASATPTLKRSVIAMPGISAGSPPLKSRSKHSSSLAGDRPTGLSRATSPLWQALDQALRATDLLLAAGGFSALVLDLGSIPAEFAWRIPLATWFRFRAAADRARTVLLVITQYPCARSSAELVLRFTPAGLQAAKTVLTGAQFHVRIDRRRFENQPVDSAAQERKAATHGKLRLVPDRKQPQRETTWHRAAVWSSAARINPEVPSTAHRGAHA